MTTNYEGGAAYVPDKHTQLYLMSATQMVKAEKFYGDKNEQYEEWVSLVREMARKDPTFVLKLAVYIRNEMKLRTAAIILFMEVVLTDYGEDNVFKTKEIKQYAPHILKRADEMAECIAYFKTVKGDVGNQRDKGSLPNVLKTVINERLNSFTPYQLLKNDKNNSSVSLRDVLRICHPIPFSSERSGLYRKIVKNEPIPELAESTWESYISKHGSSKETWTNIIEKMPIMALLRNIRNFLDNDVSPAVITNYVVNKLTDEKIITNSRLLPFRFYQAYKEIKGRNHMIDQSLEVALTYATVNNIPELDGVNAVFVDTSGSMSHSLNDKSSISYNEIASLFGALIYRKNPRTTLLYGYDSDVRNLTGLVKPNDSIFYNLQKIQSTDGGATYANKCVMELINKNIRVDRIIFLSDMQSYTDHNGYDYFGGGNERASVQELMRMYRSTVNNNVRIYDIDLSGYGTVQFDPNDVRNIQIGGWSERIFDLIKVFEDGKNIKDVLNKIEC